MAAIETVRVVLMPDQADSADRQIVVDMTRDTETLQSTGPFPAFGRAGDFKNPKTLFPFALMFDGRLDFGAYASDLQREHKLELRDAKLVPGEVVACHRDGASEAYVIDTVKSLLAD